MFRPITDPHVNTEGAYPHPAQPEDMVGIMLFLASDMSKKINGAIIPVDNAWSTI
jgi:NAD(P)-dependent dehydrogenase (short-subunit alcohol dehydrogenase family)